MKNPRNTGNKSKQNETKKTRKTGSEFSKPRGIPGASKGARTLDLNLGKVAL